MYPTKEEMNKKWWHRLVKVLFVMITIFVIAITAYVAYFMESGNATHYKIVKNFSQFLNENESQDNNPFLKLNGRIIATASFINENDLKNFSLGCLQKNGKIEYLSEYLFENETNCDAITGLNCTVSNNICDGQLSNVVKYQSEVKYGFLNYFFILLKIILVLFVWALLCYLAYYKGFLYVIYGKK